MRYSGRQRGRFEVGGKGFGQQEVRFDTDEGAAPYNGLYPWRLYSDRYEKTIPNLYRRDVPGLRLHLHQCRTARFAVAPLAHRSSRLHQGKNRDFNTLIRYETILNNTLFAHYVFGIRHRGAHQPQLALPHRHRCECRLLGRAARLHKLAVGTTSSHSTLRAVLQG